MMFKVLLFLALTSILQNHSKLIEDCPYPWEAYTVQGFPKALSTECPKKCIGKAFHTEEGNLICFHEKDFSRRKPMNRNIKYKKLTCECGYFVKGFRKNWMPCNISIPDVTVSECTEFCHSVTTYLLKRRSQTTIIHCETASRSEFYEMAGEIGQQITIYNYNKKYRSCTCGINDLQLKPVIRDEILNSGTFEECSEPWVAVEFRVQTVTLCSSHCTEHCKGGRGFHYHGKPFCFKKSYPAIHKEEIGKKCVCGRSKRIQKKHIDRSSNKTTEFLPCDPPIFKNDLDGKQCVKFCSKTTVYIYKNLHTPLTIRCIYKTDSESLQHRKLVAKCDTDVSTKDNGGAKYMICRCGLNKLSKDDSEISKNEVPRFPNDSEIKVPDAWLVKKKRSTSLRVRSSKDNDIKKNIPP